MKHYLGWFFVVLFSVLTLSMLLLHNWIHVFILLLLIILSLPTLNSFLEHHVGQSVPLLLRIGMILGLLILFVMLLLGTGVSSIYKSPDIKARFMQIYNEKMQQWPVPYQDVFVDTQYGKVHVIVSGPKDAPPMLLLHASGVAGWSWKYNVEGLSQEYRTYAIDLIGDVGKSELSSMDHVMKTPQDQAELYLEITTQLDVPKAFVVGASEGGFIATNYALFHPERVEKMVLLAPMGYSGALKASLLIMFTQMFPLKSIQESTFSWAFSDNETLKTDYNEWFHLLMSGYNPAKVIPLPFSAEQRQSLQVPVLFVFGERDNLIGDPDVARALVQDIPKVKVEVVEAGHLMGGEIPQQVNALILYFFGSTVKE